MSASDWSTSVAAIFEAEVEGVFWSITLSMFSSLFLSSWLSEAAVSLTDDDDDDDDEVADDDEEEDEGDEFSSLERRE
jgi:hypothetical protein